MSSVEELVRLAEEMRGNKSRKPERNGNGSAVTAAAAKRPDGRGPIARRNALPAPGGAHDSLLGRLLVDLAHHALGAKSPNAPCVRCSTTTPKMRSISTPRVLRCRGRRPGAGSAICWRRWRLFAFCRKTSLSPVGWMDASAARLSPLRTGCTTSTAAAPSAYAALFSHRLRPVPVRPGGTRAVPGISRRAVAAGDGGGRCASRMVWLRHFRSRQLAKDAAHDRANTRRQGRPRPRSHGAASVSAMSVGQRSCRSPASSGWRHCWASR